MTCGPKRAPAVSKNETSSPGLKCCRAVERHVLEQVRQPALVVVFEHGAGLHRQPHQHAFFRARVLAHVVAQAIGQRPDGHGRVGRQRAGEWRRPAPGRAVAPAARRAGAERQGQKWPESGESCPVRLSFLTVHGAVAGHQPRSRTGPPVPGAVCRVRRRAQRRRGDAEEGGTGRRVRPRPRPGQAELHRVAGQPVVLERA